MKISTGNFGNVVAEPQRQAQVSGNDPIGQAVSQLGKTVGGIAEDMQQAVLVKQRSQAALTLATLTEDMHSIHDEIGRGVMDGSVPADQAVTEYKKRVGERTGERTSGLTNDQRLLIDDHLIKASGTLERNLNGVAVKRTQSDTEANLMSMGEQFQRSAMRDLPGAITQWDASVDAMGPQAGWDPAKIAETKQKFKEGAHYNFNNAALEGAAQTGNVDLVVAMRKKIEGPEGEAIDPAKRITLITKAYAYENGILAAGVRDAEKAKREQEGRENKGRDAFKEAQNTMLNGRYLSTEYLSRLTEITAGTSVAPAVQELVKSQAEAAGFASLPLSQQTAIIERRRAPGSTKGVGTSPDEEKMTDYLERIKEGGKKAYAENAWTAAQERGVIARAPAVSLNNIQEAQAVLGERMKQIETVEAAAERKISPLQPQEAEQIGRLVRSLPPDQQSSALSSFGTLINDGDRLAALAQQIDAKDKVLGTMMMIGDLKTTHGRYVSELVAKGDRAIRDKTVKVDGHAETGWRGEITKEIGEAYPNQLLREKMIDAAYYVQAGLKSEGNDDLKRAVRLATGGGIIEHNGSRIPLPQGMEEGDFSKRLKAIQPASFAPQAPGGQVFVGAGKTPIPIEQFVKSLPSATLEHAGQGRYAVKAGTGYVTRADGKKLVVEVRNAN